MLDFSIIGSLPICIFGNVLYNVLTFSKFSPSLTMYLILISIVIAEAYVKFLSRASCGNISLMAPLFS